MSAHGFRSVFMVGAIASAALGCYLVSLRVASERAMLESVENKIALAQRDIRSLETEIGTRGRLAQLERWNVKVIRLSAPSADQFVDGAFQLATLAKPEARPAISAPVVLASAPIGAQGAQRVTRDDGAARPRSTAGTPPASPSLGAMMHVASYSKPDAAEVRAAPRAAKPAPVGTAAKSAGSEAAKPVKTAKTAKTAAPARTATGDPLAPMSSADRGGSDAAKRPEDSGARR